MINIDKNINYWKTCSENDIETASILINNNKVVEGLFFFHLSIEKILKALIVSNTKQLPPKSHDLLYLAELANVELSAEDTEFMQILMKYQLEGRYPEHFPNAPSMELVNDYMIC